MIIDGLFSNDHVGSDSHRILQQKNAASVVHGDLTFVALEDHLVSG